MRTNHIDKYIESYLDNTLSPEIRRQVDLHIEQCTTCALHLANARRLHNELGSAMQMVLGNPNLPPGLRYQVNDAIKAQEKRQWFYINWAAWAKVMNAVGTIAVVVFLAFGVYVVIQGQIPGLNMLPATQNTLGPNKSGGDELVSTTVTPTAVVKPITQLTPAPTSGRVSRGDTLPVVTPLPFDAENSASAQALSENNTPVKSILNAAETLNSSTKSEKQQLPGSKIAFPLFNGEMYQIHFVNPDGTGLHQFSLTGVSEPALHPADNNFELAFRSWNDPNGPRALISSNMQAEQPESVTHFWEDGQPDWSPVENRIIFASQRESDRRWRLYSVWGDGSLEVNLRREGKSPTFAPDGYRFAFESCDETGKRCGLWRADLDHSEHDATPFLQEPLAKSPDWSPVAEEIVYMSNNKENWDLYLVNSDGSNVRRLTTNSARDGLPVWSPDGKWVAFVSDRGGQWGIWLLNIAGGEMQKTVSFREGTLSSPNRPPYSEHDERFWWDEQISWK